MHITPILLKNYSFHNFLKRSKDIVRGNYLWGNFPGGIIREQLSGGGGTFSRGQFSSGHFQHRNNQNHFQHRNNKLLVAIILLGLSCILRSFFCKVNFLSTRLIYHTWTGFTYSCLNFLF